MADNVTANSGTGGATFASDDIGGVQFPRVKLVHGADGVNAGDVAAANPLPTKLTDGTNAVAVKAASTAAGATDPALVVAVSPNAGLALDATLTGGTQVAIARGGAKGATTAATLTGTAEGADHQALDVQIYHGGTAKDPTAVRALTVADVVNAAGAVAHDGVCTGNPLLNGGIASATAPADVSADGDAVRAWHLKNGAACVNLTAAGALIPGDATVGLRTACSGGTVAHDAVDSGNPVKVGGKAANALPAAVSNGDRADLLTDTYGRLMIAHVDPAMQVWKSFNATTTQTGAAVWTPASGKKVVITALQIGAYGTTAARLILWFGAGGGSPDTTYTEGTDQPVIKQSFAPSANGFPGLLLPTHTAIYANAADLVLRVTTDAGMSFDITVYGYEV